MQNVKPQVYLINRPSLDYEEIAAYLEEVGGSRWLERIDRGETFDSEDLIEFAGRICYRSWEPGLNPNVTRVREDQEGYLKNVLASMHGSVLEHASFTFVLHNVSRVFTHDHVRHRVGVGISQESLRFVRLDDFPFWWPDWTEGDAELRERGESLLKQMEEFQNWMAEHFKLDEKDTSFHEKKLKTSFMRRFAPQGVATGLVWTANLRTLRHVIELRTSSQAEEEIRLVFNRIGEIMKAEAPVLFGDYEVNDQGEWIPGWRKV